MPDGDRPLVGMDEVDLPKWTVVDQQVADAGLWRTLRALPAGIAVVARLAWQASGRLTMLTGALALAAGCVTAFGLLATADALTALLAAGPTPQRVIAALPAVLLVVIAFSARAVLESASAAAQAVLTPRVEQAAQEKVHAAVAGVELVAFEDSDYADLLRQCLTHGMRSIETSVGAIAGLGGSLVHLAAAVITAGVLHPLLAPVILLAVLPQVWASARAARLAYQFYLRMISRSRRRGIAGDLLTGRDTAAELRASTAGRALLAEYRRISQTLTDEARRLELAKTRVRLAGRAVAGVGTGVAFAVLGLLLHSGSIPLAGAGAAVVAMRLAASALSSTMLGVTTLYENTLYLDLYTRLQEQTRARSRRPSTLTAPADPERITLEHVSFSYPGQDTLAVRDLSLTIHKGQVIALVGENGSGKSTLAKLITGLYLPSSGRVCWDGTDLALVDEGSVYQRIAMVLQDPARWPMTAHDNIRMGRIDRTDPDAVELAAVRSGADAVIAELPHGAQTVLSRQFSNGQDLSGGQWQRISVARGLYRNAPILVADEPTAAMDARAEDVVFQSLRRLARTGTTILITHRLANIQHADRIVVLDHGRVAEDGTHAQLIARDGIYAGLFRLQAAGYQADLVFG